MSFWYGLNKNTVALFYYDSYFTSSVHNAVSPSKQLHKLDNECFKGIINSFIEIYAP